MIASATPTPLSAAASFRGAACPPLELLEARQLRDALQQLLRKEQAAAADFLVALADFDRRRGWERLGHANLFAFISSELGLSPAPTYWRQQAARLLQRFPELEVELRQGRLCLTVIAELAKVLTDGNKASVLPRFLGISSRVAKEIVAELRPLEAPATRTVVTRMPGAALASAAGAAAYSGSGLGAGVAAGLGSGLGAGAISDSVDVAGTVHRLSSTLEAPLGSQLACPTGSPLDSPETGTIPLLPIPPGAPPSQLWAPKVDFGGAAGSLVRRDEIEPLSGERSRLHVSVSRQFTRKLEAARQGLGHSIPSATIEQALEAALDLLLEKQAKARGQVRRPKKTVAAPTPISNTTTATAMPPNDAGTEPAHRRSGPREAVPAAIKRAVWARDGGRCSWPLDSGGVCGSTHRLELDHVVPWARDGEPTVANLRLTCHQHNAMAARLHFGARVVERYARAVEVVCPKA